MSISALCFLTFLIFCLGRFPGQAHASSAGAEAACQGQTRRRNVLGRPQDGSVVAAFLKLSAAR
jgi:hypothetical protein